MDTPPALSDRHLTPARNLYIALLLSLSLSATAYAKEHPPKKFKVKIKAPLALTDGKGHYFLLEDPLKKHHLNDLIFYGTGKKLYRQRSHGYGSDATRQTWNITLLDRRRAFTDGSTLSRDDHGGITLRCGKRKIALTQLHGAEARHLQTRARLYDFISPRVPSLLARDDTGRYYYIERLNKRSPDLGLWRGLRLWIGKLGQVHLLRARDVIVDPAGVMIFTKKGTIKVNAKGNHAWWIAPPQNTKSALTVVPMNRTTRALIYKNLGVYTGRRFWAPCDEL